MSKRVNTTAIEKYKIIKPIILGFCSIHSTAKKMGIPESTVRDWLRKYKAHGFSGLEVSKTWKKYSEKLKILAVEDVVVRKQSIAGLRIIMMVKNL